MNTRKFKNEKEKIQYRMIEVEDFEFVNPILKMCDVIIGSYMEIEGGRLEFLLENNLYIPVEINKIGDELESRAIKRWKKYLEKIQSQELPPSLYKLLLANSRDIQFNLLRGLSLTGYQLMKFIFDVCEKNGYSYSCYISRHNHNGINDSDLPHFACKNEVNEIHKIGETQMTDGEIKHAINYKKMIIAKFIDKNDSWHCFFYTLKSLKGEERGSNVQPHMHYISNKWGIPRNEVILQLKSKNYKLPSKLPHINFHR